MSKRIVVIGGGPGGYVAAIRASQLGAQVTLIEKDTLGGTCVNRGCIPTKVLLRSAEVLTDVKDAADYGIVVEGISIDFPAVTKRKEAVIRQLLAGVTTLMEKNKIEVVNGTGTLIDSSTVGIVGTSDQLRADSIIIATGSKVAEVSIDGIDGSGVITSNEALTMERLPKSTVIVGGGVIGLEFAQILRRMGGEVTVVEIMPQILPGKDWEIANMLTSILRDDGINIFTNASVTSIRSDEKERKVVTFSLESQKREIITEKVLISVGRRPNTNDLGIDKLGLAMDGGAIVVNQRMETNIPGIYAVGDVVGGFMLAHVAMAEGRCAAENIMDIDSRMGYEAVPRCVYTSPEVASVGITETESRERYGEIRIGRFPLMANGRALTLNNKPIGMVKIIAEPNYGQILGVQILGPGATELIGEAAFAIRTEATFSDIVATMHAHPTLSETMMEAALATGGQAIHW